jgi:hypothetical protein
MTTHMVDHLDAFYAEARRVLMINEIKRTPQSDEDRAREAEAFIETLTSLSGAMDRLLMNVLGEADEEIGAMSDVEKHDSYRIVSEAIEGNWDWPFRRYAAEVCGLSTTRAPHASERLTPQTQGVQTGRRAA